MVMKGSTTTHAIMVDFLQQRLGGMELRVWSLWLQCRVDYAIVLTHTAMCALVRNAADERRALVVEVTAAKEREKVEAIRKYRKKQSTRARTVEGSDPGRTDTGGMDSNTSKDAGDSDDRVPVHQQESKKAHRSRYPTGLRRVRRVYATTDSRAARTSSLLREGRSLDTEVGSSESPHAGFASALQARWSPAGAGVWVRVGPGKWTNESQEAPSHPPPVSTKRGLGPSEATTATCGSTQVVAFDGAASPAKRDTCTSKLLRSDAQWTAFVAAVDTELGHELAGRAHPLAVEDLE